MTRSVSEAVRQRVLEQIPVGHFGTTDQVAAVVLFLVSDEASYITGQVIRVDGGMVMS
jgi:3-oxoacyl-[acyl-carrier protein] reductase